MTKTEFDKEQFLSAYPVGVENNYWTVARNLVVKSALNRFGIKNNKILEIGCGRGIVVDSLRKSGFECFGVELSEIETMEEVSKYIKSGTDFVNLERELLDKVEVVLLLDVIEHLPNPEEFLKQIHSTFKSLKYVVVTVPARMDIWSNYDTYYGHFTRYNLKTLRSVLEKAELVPERINYFFHSLYLPAKILKMVGRDREVKISSPSGFSVYFHRILGLLFYLESKILPGYFPGTSIISVSSTKKDHKI